MRAETAGAVSQPGCDAGHPEEFVKAFWRLRLA
jgi:hypothetical protein